MARASASTARQDFIEAADRLLSTVGCTGASMGRILELSGAPRGSLYHYFPNGRNQIVAEAIENFDRHFRELIEATMARDEPLENKVEKFVGAMVRQLQKTKFQSSCVVSVVLLELDPASESDGALHALCSRILSDWVELIASHIREFDADQRRSIASMLVSALEGAWILCRAHRSAVPLIQAKELLITQIRALNARPRRTTARASR